MAGTIGTGRPSRLPHVTLNSDGRHHTALNALTIFTLIAGVASFALGLFVRADPSSGLGVRSLTAALGLAAMVVGLGTQMMSATREERLLIVPGIIAGFVGFALGLAAGGFSG